MNLRAERGQTSAEYVGLAFVLVAVVAVLVTGAGDIGGRLAGGVQTAICLMTGSCDGADGGSSDDRDDPAADEGDGRADTGEGTADEPGSGAEGPQPGSAADGEVSDETVAELAALAADGSPGEVAAFFETLTPAQQATLAEEHPELVGGLDGAPIELRYDANLVLIDRAAAESAAEVGRLQAELDDEWWNPFARRSLEAQIEHEQGRAEQFAEWADSDRQFLLFDPSGDGQVAEVIGDLEAAEHVAYFVPGVGNDIDDFDGGTRASAEQIQDVIAEQSPDAQTATIAWLGYDPPEGKFTVAAARADRAEGAADRLPDFVAGVAVQTGDQHVTVVGHSYGSVATSLAAQNGLVVDDIVLIGSPGARADHADDLGGATVWAALADGDDIGGVTGIDIGGLGHGTDPVGDDFGGLVFDTGEASGHSDYLREGTLSAANIAAIITGDDDKVVLE